jgi:hypothetical protein
LFSPTCSNNKSAKSAFVSVINDPLNLLIMRDDACVVSTVILGFTQTIT